VEAITGAEATPPEVRKIPVVMLTGHEQFESSSLEAGAQGYITKPFDLYQLKEILSKFLSLPPSQ